MKRGDNSFNFLLMNLQGKFMSRIFVKPGLYGVVLSTRTTDAQGAALRFCTFAASKAISDALVFHAAERWLVVRFGPGMDVEEVQA